MKSLNRKAGILSLLAPALLLGGLALLAGCMPDTELGGAPVPNALPDTRLTGQPPTLRETDFIVRFFWTGHDPDGKVTGFQWKLSNNGTDGLSVQDTLTFDPATGDTLHPWRFTTRTDTTFIVTADMPGFPNDSDLNPRDQRAYQTHTLFVRAVDDQGGVDATPAFMSFTATTLLPTIYVSEPRSIQSPSAAPPTVAFGWTGTDPDFALGVPTKVRYLWKRARLPDGSYISSRYAWENFGHLVFSFTDSAWSNWIPYAAKPDNRLVSFPDQPQYDSQGNLIYYLFAVQAMDTAGAVSVDATYNRNVHNVSISTAKTPLLTVREKYLGVYLNTSIYGIANYDIAQGQPLSFSWIGSASDYAGIITAYRYGWDIVDPNDPNDPNWSLPPGNTLQHRRAPIRSFDSGTHTLTVHCWDNSNQLTRITIVLSVVPVPQPADQKPLLLVDDVFDSQSNQWQGDDGVYYDRDGQRDGFWEGTLTGSGGVIDFSPTLDVIDTNENPQFGYREVVDYRTLIWSTKKVGLWSYIDNNFNPDPQRGGEKFVWLSVYQERVGNVLLTGQQVLHSFIGDYGMVGAINLSSGNPITPARWVTPIIFDTTEEILTAGANRYALGFGRRRDPDGSVVMIGKERYPYAIWGIAALDQPSSDYHVWPGVTTAQSLRKSNCVGNKAIVLDPAFKAAYLTPGAIADTIYSWRRIDWRDFRAPGYPTYPLLSETFQWGLDEFYDTNITERVTPIVPQLVADPDNPGALRPAIDVMFRMYTRYDWIDDIHHQRGDPGWPLNVWSMDELVRNQNSICGRAGVNELTMRTRITGAPCGFLSHKMESTKPSGRGNVCWGFDPSRFDREQIRRAIRWVLRDQFGLLLSP